MGRKINSDLIGYIEDIYRVCFSREEAIVLSKFRKKTDGNQETMLSGTCKTSSVAVAYIGFIRNRIIFEFIYIYCSREITFVNFIKNE